MICVCQYSCVVQAAVLVLVVWSSGRGLESSGRGPVTRGSGFDLLRVGLS